MFQPRVRNDPYAPTYNPGWKNHPNFSWNQGQYNQFNQNSQPAFEKPNPDSYPPQTLGHYPNSIPLNPLDFSESDKKLNSIEKSMEALLKSQQSFMQAMTQDRQLLNLNTQAICKLEVQVNQLANTISEREKNYFPSQPEVNPKFYPNQRSHKNVNSIIFLRSDNQFNNHAGINTYQEDKLTSEPNPLLLNPSLQQPPNPNPKTSKFNESSPSKEPPSKPHSDASSEKVFKPKAPFPQRLISNKQSAQLDMILEVFKQVKINIPLLDAIQQVTSYSKCLKDLCTHKRTTHVPKKAFLTSHISSILSKQIPVKYKDPGCPTIFCVIGNTFIDKALLDLGASVNLLPLSVYQALSLGELKNTSITLKLVDLSVKTPKGIVEDVLIKIGDFIFPVDFIVLEIEPFKNLKNQIPIISGRSFLATSNTLIKCRNGSMKLTFGNMSIYLNIFNVGNQPNELFEQPVGVNLINKVVSWSNLEDNAIESLLEDDVLREYESNRELHELYKNFTCDGMFEELNAIYFNHETQLEASYFDPKTVVKTSVGEPPTLDPIHSFSTLEQSLLVNNKTHHVVISSRKVHNQEFQVINLLKQHKEASNWSMNNVSAMSFILMHDLISLVDNIVLMSEFHMCVDCVTKVVSPRSGIG
ncbi:uncharacterized protein LOC141680078 [Apium graveolens]|uniref:uncharacterized protein LOC141680078 n=1 Tax=Apium graveolens TaxID=4045 RepID=UPI003D7B4904